MMRAFCRIISIAFVLGAGARAADPNFCFAFLRGGDVFVSCGGRETQLTKQGTVNSFAIAEQQGVLGIVTAWTVIGANSASLMNMDLAIDLKAVQAKFAGDAHKLVSTCGGLFGVVGTKRFPGWSNLLTGPGVPPNPYAWFRCSFRPECDRGNCGEQPGVVCRRGSGDTGGAGRRRVLRIQRQSKW